MVGKILTFLTLAKQVFIIQSSKNIWWSFSNHWTFSL